MHDQASDLRQMMRFAARDTRSPRQLRLIAVAGARHGVGATTVAVNLAAEWARQGRRTILIDADLEGGDVAARCGLGGASSEALLGVAEVLTARRDLSEVLHDGPFGLSIAPGVCRVEQLDAWSEAAHDRLIRALRNLEGEADFVVLDAGRGMSTAGHRFCDMADETLIVTTTDDDALMDTYATLKTTHDNGHRHSIRVLFNRVQSNTEAQSASDRLAQTCRRFLGITARYAGRVAEDRRVTQAAQAGVPLIAQSPRSPLAREIERLAATIISERNQPMIPMPQASLALDRSSLVTA